MSEWRKDSVTEKQLSMIQSMQETASINGAIPLPEFHGKTKGEACDYIQENIHKQYDSFDVNSHASNYGDR